MIACSTLLKSCAARIWLSPAGTAGGAEGAVILYALDTTAQHQLQQHA
jgi:two-component system cell cycle sensor histidine kinase/response regulator CckA